MMTEVQRVLLPYGRRAIEITAEADLIAHRGAPPVADETGAVYEALADPIGTPPLAEIVKPGERVAVIVNDITRLTRTDLLLPPVIDTLNRAGVPDGDIFIVFALGIHRPQTDAERRSIVGEEVFRRIRNFDHICTDEANLVTLGTTRFGNTVEVNRQVMEADRIILTGEIMYHLIAGYSGGRKSLAPGVAGRRTTTFNHNMIFDPRCASGILDGNPSHEDLLEACRMADPDFLLNVVLTPDGKLARVVAGDFDAAHRAGCRVVDEVLSAEVGEPYDVLIASAGGYPLDIDLRQAHKGLENACRALKPGGAILFFAECANGSGHPLFDEYVARYRDDFEMRRALEERFEVGGHKAYWVARLGRQFNVHLVSALPVDFVERCHLHPVEVDGWKARLAGLLRRGARAGVIPHAGHTLPRLGPAHERHISGAVPMERRHEDFAQDVTE
jgi:nickel-dependent lactate racemase